MSTLKEIRTNLESVAKGLKAANAQVQKAQAKRSGAYNGAVAVAILAANPAQLEKAFDGLFADIQTDGKLAVACGAAKRKKATKDGKKYTVPASLQVAKSTLIGAMRLGVSLTDAETGEPRSFGGIRTAKAEAELAAKEANATDDEKLQAEVRTMLDSIGSHVELYADGGLVKLADAVAEVYQAVLKDDATADAIEAEAESLAEAA
jgi:hypothetical protein